MATLDTAEIRRKTAELLRQRGWIRDDYLADSGTPTEGKLCMVEAIGQAAGLPPLSLVNGSRRVAMQNDPALHEQYQAVINTVIELATALGQPKTSIQTPMDWLLDWNDDTARTVDEVLAALEGQAV
ncbi:DUF6197 family protein [Nonomuraea wenchangensis]|uniref:DUF6197 family protein n=1 Tax=Nonomuraea wenchangensis TaxID=568860 RepID=UPI0033329737